MQPLQLQPYAYAFNSPLSFTDPDGLWGWSAIVHTALDVAGMVPVIGEAADLVNAGIYAAEGDWTNAALSAASAIPMAGNAVAAVKMARNAKKAIDAAEAVGKKADDVADVAKAAPPVKVKDPEPPTKVSDNTQRSESCAVSNSFTPDTPVLMDDGSTTPITEVQVGDEVLAADPTTGVQESRKVVATISAGQPKPVVQITVRDIAADDARPASDHRTKPVDEPAVSSADQMNRDGTISGQHGDDESRRLVATTNHPFWVQDLQAWVPAGNLQPGMWLRSAAGTWVQVAAVRPAGTRADVQNLTVEGLHTYFVSVGSTAFLVHNSQCLDLPEGFEPAPSMSDRAIGPVEPNGRMPAEANPVEGPAPKYHRRTQYSNMTPANQRDTLAQDPKCVYCGTRRSTQADHVYPVSKHQQTGGWASDKAARSADINRRGNLVGACQPCNGSAGKSGKVLGPGPGQFWPQAWPRGYWWYFGGGPRW